MGSLRAGLGGWLTSQGCPDTRARPSGPGTGSPGHGIRDVGVRAKGWAGRIRDMVFSFAVAKSMGPGPGPRAQGPCNVARNSARTRPCPFESKGPSLPSYAPHSLRANHGPGPKPSSYPWARTQAFALPSRRTQATLSLADPRCWHPLRLLVSRAARDAPRECTKAPCLHHGVIPQPH